MEMSGRILKMRVPGACGCGCAGENTREQLVAGGDGNDEGQKRARGVWSREAIECESERERERVMSEIVSAGAGASKKNGSVQKRILKTAKKVRGTTGTRSCGPRVPFSRLLFLPSLELEDREPIIRSPFPFFCES